MGPLLSFGQLSGVHTWQMACSGSDGVCHFLQVKEGAPTGGAGHKLCNIQVRVSKSWPYTNLHQRDDAMILVFISLMQAGMLV